MFNTVSRQGSKFENGLASLRQLIRNRTGLIGLIIIAFYVFLAIAGPALAPYPPNYIPSSEPVVGPSAAHLFGTDLYGRDILSRVLYAARLDMLLSLIGVTVGFAIGEVIGLVAGYYGKKTDQALMRGMDILLAFPGLLLAIAIAVFLGQGFFSIVVAVAVVGIPGFARITRSVVLSTKQELYVTGALSIGASRFKILKDHIFPNTLSPSLVLYSISLGTAMLVAAGLSFLGAGIPPPTAEWGAMITLGLQAYNDWWMAVFPGLAITGAVMGFNMLGEGLREAMDVTLRR